MISRLVNLMFNYKYKKIQNLIFLKEIEKTKKDGATSARYFNHEEK